MLEAGSDTSASFLQNAVQILVAHPWVQKKAQEELDRVVGLDRMPHPDDFANLPYVNAVIAEVSFKLRSHVWMGTNSADH